MSTRDVVVHSHHLAFHVLPGRLPALVLDAGGGTDSSYWDTILPELARRTGSEIITYDRAGFGASDEVPPPYRTEDAVTDLESGLIQLGVSHDLVLIPHSFAGIIATYLAMRHSDWVSGAVLIDTNVPEFFTDEEVAHMGLSSNLWSPKKRPRIQANRLELRWPLPTPMPRAAMPFTKQPGRSRFHAKSSFRNKLHSRPA